MERLQLIRSQLFANALSNKQSTSDNKNTLSVTDNRTGNYIEINN